MRLRAIFDGLLLLFMLSMSILGAMIVMKLSGC